jgi:hypothetical protein
VLTAKLEGSDNVVVLRLSGDVNMATGPQLDTCLAAGTAMQVVLGEGPAMRILATAGPRLQIHASEPAAGKLRGLPLWNRTSRLA